MVDAQEKAPFSFAGLRADSKQRNRPLVVQTRWESLGVASGDYSIAGYEPKRTDAPARVAIERKSVEDLVGTVTGFRTERRARFERELASLATLDSAVVICEGSLDACLRHCSESEHGSATRVKIFHRSIIALQQDYQVAWLFCDSRRLAEITAFRWLERFHAKTQERLAASLVGEAVTT